MTILTESIGSIESKGGKWRALIIKSDTKGSSAYYPDAALKESGHVFTKNVQMFANHLSQDEQWSRPEGDVNNLIGVLESDAEYVEGEGLYADLKIFSHKVEWLKEVAPYVGLSIRAGGIVEEGEDGYPVLKQFTEAISVDVVTRAGAGGKFVSLAESAKPGVLNAAHVVTESKEETMEFPAKLAEALDAQATDVKALTEAVKTLVEGLKKVEDVAPVEVAEAAELDVEALIEAGLTKTARARVMAAVKAETPLAEAISAEQEIAKEILAEAAAEGKGFEANLEESGKGEAKPLINW